MSRVELEKFKAIDEIESLEVEQVVISDEEFLSNI